MSSFATLRDVWPLATPLPIACPAFRPSIFVEDEIERMMQQNMTQGETLWHRLEAYGLPLVDDEASYRTDKYDREEAEHNGPQVELVFIELE